MVSDVCSRFRDEHLLPFTVGVPVIDKNLVGVFFYKKEEHKMVRSSYFNRHSQI